jgi:hypothetical protein
MGPLQYAGGGPNSSPPSSAQPPNPVPPRNAADLVSGIWPNGVASRDPIDPRMVVKKA